MGDPLGHNYELLEPIGYGAFGRVWRARARTGEIVAAKLLRPEYATDATVRARFVREHTVLSAIRHPHAVGVRDLVIEDDVLALVLEYVDGPSLRRLLAELGTLAPAEAARLVAEVCDGLAALHAAGILHRDVKPDNVLLQRGDDGLWHAKLGDFGLARMLRSSLTHTGAFTGTFEYAAPELAGGEPATPAADLYSTGIVLYELLCGVTPFRAEHPVTVVQRHQSVPPPRPDGVPDQLWELISWLLAKQPTQRPPDAAVVRDALTSLAPSLAGRPAAAALVEPPAASVAVTSTAARREPARDVAPPTVIGPLASDSAAGRHSTETVLVQRQPRQGTGEIVGVLGRFVSRRSWSIALIGVVLVVLTLLVLSLPSSSPNSGSRVTEPAFTDSLRTLTGHTGTAWVVAVAPNGRQVVSGSNDKTVRVWDLASGRLVRTLLGHANEVYAVVVTPNGRQVVSGSLDATIRVWDLATGRLVRTITGPTNTLDQIAITPNGRQVVSGYADKAIRVWDLASGRLVRILIGHTDQVFGVAVTPDGRQVISASSDKTVRVWDLATGRLVHTLRGHTRHVNGVAVTPDGRQVISASWDATLRVWDLASGRLVRTLSHTEALSEVAVTPDGRQVVSGSSDKTVRVWDLTTGRLVRILIGHTDQVFGVAVTPDGRQVISGSSDKTVQVSSLKQASARSTSPLLVDNLRSKTGLWSESSEPSCRMSLKVDGYHLTNVNSAKGACFSWASFINKLRDVSVTVDIAFRQTNPNSWAGIMCRQTDSDGYVATISPLGYARIKTSPPLPNPGRILEEARWTKRSQNPWRTHRLRFECIDQADGTTHLLLAVDGVVAVETLDKQSRVPAGYVGMYTSNFGATSGVTEVAFTNFSVNNR